MTTKRQMSEFLASREFSVREGRTAHSYWVNVFMGYRKANLITLVAQAEARMVRTVCPVPNGMTYL